MKKTLIAVLLLSLSGFSELSPVGMLVTVRSKDGFCDIRGDCWWSGKFCHRCGVRETAPLMTNELSEYLIPWIKAGKIVYVPAISLPIPPILRQNHF